MKRLEITAPAKINLFLNVLGKRPDGYHEIDSLVTPVSIADRIVLESTPDCIETLTPDRIYFDGIPWPVVLGSPDNNLTTRSARLLRDATGYKGGARITLEKKTPIGGGLGGGSADAAAVLKGLNTLWQTNLSTPDLMKLGARLGSDIPALIHGGLVRMQGRGERIEPLKLPCPPFWVLLVNPGFCVCTADIYSRYRPGLTSEQPNDKLATILSGLAEKNPSRIAQGLLNSLEKPALRKYPLLEIIKNELVKAGALGVLLSGSGSTIFALVENGEQGYALAATLKSAMGCPLWTHVAQAIGGE